MKTPTLSKITLIVLIFILSFFQASYRIGEEQIKIWDESSSARNGVEMLYSGNYLYANIDGKPDYHDVKPPLQLWVKVLSYKMFGINEFAVRFSTLLSFFLLSLLLFWFAYKHLKSTAAGLLLVIFPAITPGFMNWHMAWHGDTDLLLILFTSLYILYAFLFIESYPNNRLKYLIVLSLMVTVAYFTKSIAGLAPAAGIVLYVILKKRKILFHYQTYLPIGIFAGILIIYYAIVEYQAPGYLESIFNHHFLPFTKYPDTPKHPEFSYYINLLIDRGFYPFAYWLPIVIIPLVYSKNTYVKNFLTYLLTVSLVFLLGQSSAVMKNSWYIGPIYPLLWLILSVSIYETYMIIKERLFPKHFIIKYISYALILFLVYELGLSYKVAFQSCEQRYSGYIDHQERDGDFIRKVLKWSPLVNEINVLRKPNMFNRQMDFYVKRAKYFEDKKINLIYNSGSIKENSYVACADKELQTQITSKFFSKELHREKYGVFYYIIGSKSEPYNYYRYNPHLTDSITNEFLSQYFIIQKAKETHNDIWVTAYNSAKWVINRNEKMAQRNQLLNDLLMLEQSNTFKAFISENIKYDQKRSFNEQYDAIAVNYWGKQFASDYKSSLNLFRTKYLKDIVVNTIMKEMMENEQWLNELSEKALKNGTNVKTQIYNEANWIFSNNNQ